MMNTLTTETSPVFIIGGSRTGSEMLKTMLSASDDLDFVDETFLLTPAWLHTDLRTNIRRHLGQPGADDYLDRLIDFLYSGQPEGWFWTVIDKEIDRDALRAELQGTDLDLRSIFLAIMKLHASKNDKSGIGAKFPVHYSFADKLLEWFPNCRFVHTTRNPKAVYASQAAKYLDSEAGALSRSYTRLQHFAHINIQVAWTARIHRRFKDRPNYCLVRYEDVVNDPETELRKLTTFLNVKYLDEMLQQHQYGSSFDSIGSGRGVSKSSLDRWKQSISPGTQRFMDIVHKSAFRSFGYLNNG